MKKNIKDIVASEIYSNPDYKNMISYFLRKNKHYNKEDFFQDVLLMLMEFDDEKLQQIWDSGLFFYYYIGMVKKQSISTTSYVAAQHKRYVGESLNLTFDNNIEDDFETEKEIKILKEKRIEFINEELDRIGFENPIYRAREIKIFKMHFFKNESLRKISKKTEIPLASVFNYYNTIKQLLIKKSKENGNYNL
jgi:hypothetical protein